MVFTPQRRTSGAKMNRSRTPVFSRQQRQKLVQRRSRQRKAFLCFVGLLILLGGMFLGFSAFSPNIQAAEVLPTTPVTPLEKFIARIQPNPVILKDLPVLMNASLLDPTPMNYGFSDEIPLNRKVLPLFPEKEDGLLKSAIEQILLKYPTNLTPHIYYYDPTDKTFVSVGGYESVSAASMIKLPILMSYFQTIDEGRITGDTPILFEEFLRAGGAGDLQYKPSGDVFPANDVAQHMIQVSDNTCTNLILHSIGDAESTNDRFHAWGLTTTFIRNWLPDLEGTNHISMYEMASLLENLNQGTLLSPTSRQVALNILYGTHNRRLIPALLPKDTLVAHKTGDIGTSIGDIGIVYLPTTDPNATPKSFILAIQVDRPYNDYNARDLIQQVSLAAYEHTLAKQGVTPTEYTHSLPDSGSDHLVGSTDSNRI